MAPLRLFIALLATLTLTLTLTDAHPHHRRRPSTCKNVVKLAVGSYTFQPWLPNGNGEGVTIVELSSSSLTAVSTISNVTTTGQNPAYCQKSTLCAGGLYCVNEIGEGGAVTKFSTARKSKSSKYLARAPTESGGTTHLAVFRKWHGEMIITANYGGSSVSSLYYDSRKKKMRLLDTDVVPAKFAARFATPVAGYHPQNDPHPHHILPLTRRYFLVPDLGSDRVWLYKIGRRGKLTRYNGIALKKGDGPRHMAPGKGRNLYVVNELSNTVTRINGCTRKFLGKICERKLLLPNGGHKDTTQTSSAAIRISRDKKFLYASLRPDKQHGIIAAFALDKDGAIGKRVGIYSTRGEHPRDFYIVENGPGCESYIVVANMNSNKLVAIKRDRITGKLYDDHLVHTLIVNTPTSVLEL